MPSTPASRSRTAPLIVFVGHHDKADHFRALAAAGYRVFGVSTVHEALRHRPRPDGIIVELVVPDQELSSFPPRKTGSRIRAITVIGLAGDDRREAVVKAGARFCRYPCTPDELLEIMRQAIPLPAR